MESEKGLLRYYILLYLYGTVRHIVISPWTYSFEDIDVHTDRQRLLLPVTYITLEPHRFFHSLSLLLSPSLTTC